MGKQRERIFILNSPYAPRIDQRLAEEIGLNESIVLLQIEYAISISEKEHDELLWAYKSTRDMQRDWFPWWSTMTINRAVKSLESRGLIIVGNYNKYKYDQTRWFALNFEGIRGLQSITLVSDRGGVYQNDTRSGQNDTRSGQNDTGSDQNDTTIPNNSSKTTPKSNIQNKGPGNGIVTQERPDGLSSKNMDMLEQIAYTKKERKNLLLACEPKWLHAWLINLTNEMYLAKWDVGNPAGLLRRAIENCWSPLEPVPRSGSLVQE